MNNKPCVSCTEPLNGGVFRRPNECPHCSALQNPVLSAFGKPLPIEQAIAASRKARAQKLSIKLPTKKVSTSSKPVLGKPKLVKPAASPILAGDTQKSAAQIEAEQLEARKVKARKAYAAKAEILAAKKAELLKQKAMKEKAIRAKLAAVSNEPVKVATKKSAQTTNPFMSVSGAKKTTNATSSATKAASAGQQGQQVTSNPFLVALNKPNRANTADSFRRAARNF